VASIGNEKAGLIVPIVSFPSEWRVLRRPLPEHERQFLELQRSVSIWTLKSGAFDFVSPPLTPSQDSMANPADSISSRRLLFEKTDFLMALKKYAV
jgi:hypothetical protein